MSWIILEANTSNILANILSGIGMAIFIVASFIKSKRKILSWQCIAHSIFVIVEILSKAWSSIVQESIGIIRNLLTLTKKNNRIISIILVIIAVTFGVGVNIIFKEDGTPWYGSWVGYLPVVANLEYSIVVLCKKTGPKAIKLSFAISCILWALNFYFLGVYVSAIMNFLCSITSSYSFLKMLKMKNKTDQ